MLVFSIVSGIFAKYIIRKFVSSPLGDFVGVGILKFDNYKTSTT